MKEVTQPVRAQGTMLSAVAVVAALAALLAFAPFASATSDPVASGTTNITLNQGFFKKLKKSGVKVLKLSPGTLKNRKIGLPVASGSIDPTNGLGSLELSGGFKFKHGKKQAPVKGLVLDTAQSKLTGKVANKQMKVATVAGLTYARNGFGVNVNVAKLKLTNSAVTQLNKKLGYTSSKNKGGKKSSASASKTSSASPFKKNQLMGGSFSEAQPKTVAVIPTGDAKLVLAPSALKKLKHVGTPPFPEGTSPVAVGLSPVAPTTFDVPTLTAGFPIGGGTIGPTAQAGTVQTLGGLQLVQNLEPVTGKPGDKTTLVMGNIWLDLAAKTASVEVTITNPVTAKANLGNLGRSSIADISLVGATVTSDPATRTVSVQNASAALQAVTAATLNQVFIEGLEKNEKGEPTPFAGQEKFAAGDPLGVVSFTAQTQ
jgi:hypothetical protein